MNKIIIIILAVLPFVFSCKSKKGVANSNTPIADTAYVENPETGEINMIITTKNASPKGYWILQLIDGAHDDEMQRVSLQVGTNKSDKTIGGNDGCNSYSGQLDVLDDRRIEFGAIASTKRACIVPAKHAESYYKIIEEIKTYSATGDNLILKDKTGKKRLQFVRKE